VATAFECPEVRSSVEAAVAATMTRSLPPILGQMGSLSRWASDVCPVWMEGERDAVAAQPLTSSTGVPSLVLAGALDPVTPPADSAQVAATLEAPYVELPRSGHGVTVEPCGTRLAAAFLAAPAAPLDTSCVPADPPVRFVTSALALPSLLEGLRSLRGPRSALWLGALLVLALPLASVLAWPWLGGWPTTALRRRPSTAVVAAALCLLAFAGGLAAAVALTVKSQPVLLLFGLPVKWLPIFALPWLAVGGTARALWLLRRDSPGWRLHHGLALAAVGASLLGLGVLGLLTPRII